MHWLSLSKNLTPFILAAGNDQTDEDLFRVMPPEAFTIRVGNNLSVARHSLPTIQDLLNLLARLSASRS